MHSNWLINSRVTVCTVTPVTIHATVHTVTRLLCAQYPAHAFGPGSAQPMYLGLTRPISKKKNQKYLFQHFIIFPRSFYVILINIGWYFMLLKIQKSDIKIPGFRQKLSKIQKIKKKKKKNVFVHTAKCLKAKNLCCIFSYTKTKCFSMHFGFNNPFIKVKRILANISKTTKILFCLSLSIRGMTLHVMHIPDI